MRAFTSPRIERAVDPLFDLLREADGRERCFVLVPDRYTQTFEEQILRRTGKTVTFTTEVFSFSRLLYRLKNGRRAVPIPRSGLSGCGVSMKLEGGGES